MEEEEVYINTMHGCSKIGMGCLASKEEGLTNRLCEKLSASL